MKTVKMNIREYIQDKNITSIEKIENIDRYINEVNFYTQDEAKRCRILLARVLKMLDKLNKEE